MKTKINTIPCPCCKNKVTSKKMQQTLSLLPFDGFFRSVGQSNEDAFLYIVSRYMDIYQWACDDCIQGALAILADPNKQYFTFKHPMDAAPPYLAYFDRSYTCQKCGEKATLTKELQKHWYEELRLVVYTSPVLCKECGRQKHLNTELSDLLKNGTPTDVTQLTRIAEIYEAMGKMEKTKAYRKLAKSLGK